MKVRFAISLAVLMATIIGALILIRTTVFPNTPTVVFALPPAYALLTYVLYNNMLRAIQKNPRRFVTAVMGSITIKLFVSATFIAVYFYLKLPEKIFTAFTLFVIYITFTIAMIIAVSKQGNNSEFKI